MPTTNINDTTIWYEESGAGSETIVFSHGLLMSHKMFAAQVEALNKHFRCIAYDHRGQGRSEVSLSGYGLSAFRPNPTY